MRRDLVAQIAHLSAAPCLWQALAHLAQLLNEGVDLLLLAIHLGVELVEQVFGETGLDFKVDQSVFNGERDVHGCIGHDFTGTDGDLL